MLPKLSSDWIILGLIFNNISLSYLEILKSIYSVVDIIINFETSRMLSTLLPSISKIISFFFKPAISAGLSLLISLITGGVKSLPINI